MDGLRREVADLAQRLQRIEEALVRLAEEQSQSIDRGGEKEIDPEGGPPQEFKGCPSNKKDTNAVRSMKGGRTSAERAHIYRFDVKRMSSYWPGNDSGLVVNTSGRRMGVRFRDNSYLILEPGEAVYADLRWGYDFHPSDPKLFAREGRTRSSQGDHGSDQPNEEWIE